MSDKPNVGRVLASRDKRQGQIWMRMMVMILMIAVIAVVLMFVTIVKAVVNVVVALGEERNMIARAPVPVVIVPILRIVIILPAVPIVIIVACASGRHSVG